MNPFDLTGPQFLLFYVILLAVTALLVHTLRVRRELGMPGEGGRAPLTDPYLIATLRGGKNELVRVAVASLLDRELLIAVDKGVQTTSIGRETRARKRIERDILSFCVAKKEPKELFETPKFDMAAAEYELELERLGLRPDEAVKAHRRNLYSAGAAVLLFFSVTKIAIAFARGRTNVGFLIVLTLFALLMLAAALFRERTARGDSLLAELRNLFEALRLRAGQVRPGGGSADVALLAAVWGVSALPQENFPWTKSLFPRTSSSGSCGASCGSTCGSGCGGGGCGGGCGGCGG